MKQNELPSADEGRSPDLRQLIQEWRKNADTHARYKDSRDDPYDDVGYAHQLKAQMLRKCADELEALGVVEDLTRLRRELAYAKDAQARAESAMTEAVMNWNLVGVRAEKAEAELQKCRTNHRT